MKLAVLNINGVQSTLQGKKRYYYIVSDDYDFGSNSATDVSDISLMEIFFKLNRFDAVSFLDSLKKYYSENDFNSLSNKEKVILSKYFIATKSDRNTVKGEDAQKDDAQELALILGNNNFSLIDSIAGKEDTIDFEKISSGIPYGEIHMQDNHDETLISKKNTPVKVTGNTISGELLAFVATNNRLTYKGNEPATFQSVSTISSKSTNSNGKYTFYLSKNGLLISKSSMSRYFKKNSEGNLTLTTIISLKMDDYIEVWVENNTNDGNICICDLNLNLR